LLTRDTLDSQPSSAAGALEIDQTPIPEEGDSVTVVLPCLNEEDSVGKVVEEALRALKDAGIPGEVLVVDNGSQDRSVEIALAAGARVIHEARRGYGRAVRTGIVEAKGTIVVMGDADWTYDMTKLPILIEPVQRGLADLTIGARLHEATRESMPFMHKYVGTPALTAFIRTAGGYGSLTDSQSGFRCFRQKTISKLKLTADGMELTSEMLLKSSRHNLRVLEVPTGYRTRIGISKLNTISDGLRNLRVLIQLAPELFFLAPGAILFVIGAALHVAAFLPSRGIEIGSLRWQPTFFATIAIVLGLQTFLVGLVFVWHRASVTKATGGRGLRLIRSRKFPIACSIGGAGLIVTGLVLDLLLIADVIDGAHLAAASLAQSLLLIGGTMGSFGLVVFWLHWDHRLNRAEDL
jgi:glycosyltransferase involved in cell wall biosynthesis